MSDEIKLGDLVWAKMKGCSPWPGRVAQPKSWLKKPAKKSGIQCIYFFGSKNYAWVEDSNIKPYLEHKDKFINSYKSAGFKEAVTGIEEFIARRNDDPEYDPVDEEEGDADADFDRLKNEEKSTPKKVKKDGGIKRPAGSMTKSLVKKSKSVLSEENGSSPSFSNHIATKNYEVLLNRPSVLDRPETPPMDISTVSDHLKSKNIEASPLTFGFMGLGIMGSGIVKNLVNSGHRINLWSRTIRKAEEVKTQADAKQTGLVEVYQVPCDVIQNSDITFCCVSDPRASKDIVFGNCGVLHEGSLEGKGYVELTSIDSETSKDISNVITSKGGRYLEAQIQGSKGEAHDGTLIVLGAGDKTLFDDCQSCFRAMGRTAFYLGEVGVATKMNLVLQTIRGICLSGIAEGFALADRSGLTPKDVLEIFHQTNMNSPALTEKAEIIIGADFLNPRMPLQHMQKDLKLALELADSLQQPLLMAATANEMFKHARRLGYDKHDSAAVFMRARH